MRNINDIDGCEVGNCTDKAITIVYSRILGDVVACCEIHRDVVIDEGCPEYFDICSNCKCEQGVN